MEVGIRELKNRLSDYIARVMHGESVVVTEHGKPVARLEPMVPGEPSAELIELVKAVSR